MRRIRPTIELGFYNNFYKLSFGFKKFQILKQRIIFCSEISTVYLEIFTSKNETKTTKGKLFTVSTFNLLTGFKTLL